MGILETKLKKANGAPTVHYLLKESAFSESILEFLTNEFPENSRNLDPEKSEESINRDYQSLHTGFSAGNPFCGEAFLTALADFEQHRKEHKRPIRPTERKALCKKLSVMGEAIATTALRQSVEAGWLSVFEPKEASGSGPAGEHPNAYRPGKMVV